MKHKISKLLFFLFFTLLIPFSLEANATRVLLLPFTINVSEQKASLERTFMQELENLLKTNGIEVIKGKERVQSSLKAFSLIEENKAEGALYGTLSQIGNSINVSGQYVDASGKAKDISFQTSTDSSTSSIATRLVELTKGSQQTQLPPVSDTALSEVRIEGNRILDEEVIYSRMNLMRGDPVPTAKELDAEVKRIWSTGYFDDLSAQVIQENGANIFLISVKERPPIEDVLVEGSDAVKIKAILEVMSSRTGAVLNDRVLVEDIERITELYRKKGFYNAQVDYTIKTNPRGGAALVFTVNEGNKLYIRDIVFEGIENLDKGDLNKFLALKTRGMFSVFTGSGVLKEEDLARDAQTLAAFAVNEGYIQAQVGTPEVIYGEKGITIKHKINEGPRFALGEINFAGDLIADLDVFYDTIKLDEWKKKNKYFSLNTLQDDIRRLTLMYNNEGYAFVQVNVQDDVDIENAIINITFTIDPKEKVYVNRVEVAGNYDTRDNVIIRELRLADGDLFSGAKLQRSQERLMKTGYFKNVNISLQPTSNPSQVDLSIAVEEDNTGVLTAGVGYSTYDGVGFSASIAQNNLFGRGYKLGIEGYISEKTMNISSYFWNPRLYDTEIGAGIRVYGIENEWLDYDKDTLGTQLSFSYPLGEYSNISWGYRIDKYKIYNIDDDATASIKDYEGDNLASVLLLGVGRDTTDALFFPTKGTKARISLQYGGGIIGGSDNFIRTQLDLGFYHLLSENHVLHARGTLGGVFKNTSKVVPAFERYYIGGIGTIRGFDYEDISPRDPDTSESIGADRVLYASAEYVWQFEPELGLAIVPFFDFALASDSSQSSFFDQQYYSVGLELRWSSPMGDLRFSYGYPLTRNVDGDSRSSGRFEFTMGQAF